MLLFRLIYFASVLIGLYINVGEYNHARWVYAELWKRRINGERQLIARTFRSEELMRVWIQVLLLFIAAGGLYIPARDWSGVAPSFQRLAFALVTAHIAVVVILAVKALKHRAARRAILSLSTPTVQA